MEKEYPSELIGGLCAIKLAQSQNFIDHGEALILIKAMCKTHDIFLHTKKEGSDIASSVQFTDYINLIYEKNAK